MRITWRSICYKTLTPCRLSLEFELRLLAMSSNLVYSVYSLAVLNTTQLIGHAFESMCDLTTLPLTHHLTPHTHHNVDWTTDSSSVHTLCDYICVSYAYAWLPGQPHYACPHTLWSHMCSLCICYDCPMPSVINVPCHTRMIAACHIGIRCIIRTRNSWI